MARWVFALAALLLLPGSPRAQSAAQAPPASANGVLALATPAAGTPDHERLAPVAQAVRLTGPIDVDGELDEPIWQSAPAVTRFFQREPNQGSPATQPTEVRFLYDDETLYIGARMFDSLGAAGVV